MREVIPDIFIIMKISGITSRRKRLAMESIASKLRTRRESLNISLEQVSSDTRISIHHLKNLESGCYADLPGGMYNRAILRAYCDELGLDKDEILQHYDDEISPQPVIDTSPPTPSRIKIHTAVIWSLLFLLAVGLFLNREWFFTALFSSSPMKTASATVKTGTDASMSGGDKIIEAPPEQTVPATTKAETTAPQPLLRLEITGTEECWLSVNRDESGAVTKILSPGEVEFYTAARTISLTIGNAGGVALRINERAAKTLGSQGQVVHLIIDKDTLQNFIDPSSS